MVAVFELDLPNILNLIPELIYLDFNFYYKLIHKSDILK